MLLSVRGCDAAQEALSLMLEWRLLPNEEARLQVVSALQSTESGRIIYSELCQRQRNLQELVSLSVSACVPYMLIKQSRMTITKNEPQKSNRKEDRES